MWIWKKHYSLFLIALAVLVVAALAGYSANYQIVGSARLTFEVQDTATLGADDATPDVSTGVRFITQANVAPTAITDLDNPTVDQTVIIIGGSASNSTTITDGGNFSLNGNWTADVDSCLALYVQADNDYVEIGRSDVMITDAELIAIGALTPTDSNFIVGNGATWVAETGNTARTSLGVGTGDSPTFTSLTLSGRLVSSTVTTFADQDATPSVSTSNVFKTANTLATTVIAFDDGSTAQRITVIFTDALTTIQDGANLNLQGGIDFTSTGDDIMEFVWDGTSWFELSRSLN